MKNDFPFVPKFCQDNGFKEKHRKVNERRKLVTFGIKNNFS